MVVPVKLSLSVQLLMTEKVHFCIKMYNIYVKHDVRRPTDNRRYSIDSERYDHSLTLYI